MTKKDYQMIIEILNRWVGDKSLRALLAIEFASRCAADNPRFDRAKFFNALKKD